ncbi:hypothetical protein GCM10010276_43620 [Streptomyces longisporus]|uniref:Uncharacterized protein n=1 Tax=Streptomyces longisporus TaxID=1948 RepID=A0ABN3MA35_STRLO
MAVPGDAFALAPGKCEVTAHLKLGRAQAVSKCQPFIGPSTQRRVNHHRAVIKCANIRATGGTEHDIYVTLNGPWKYPGQTSTITCPIRSSLAGYWQQTN